MDQRLIDLLHDAKRWADAGRDYLPTLGCSSCGKGCMPLCGLGLNRKVSPMESKDVVLKTRKSMIETGKRAHPLNIQLVTGTEIVIVCEKALDCIEEREITTTADGPTTTKQWVFTKPIPTAYGLLCRDCSVCMLCREPTSETVRRDGRPLKICVSCMEACDICQQIKVKHHPCCARRQ